MRILQVNDLTKAKVAEVLKFAASNRYRPGKSETVPGDDPRHTVMLDSFRCVFSYTEMGDGHLFRHLSISVPSKKYPNPFAVWVIAELFGFTGWDGQSANAPGDWFYAVKEIEHCIVLVQELSLWDGDPNSVQPAPDQTDG